MVRAKFVCSSKTDFGDKVSVEFHAVHSGSEENMTFWQYTPSGRLEMQMLNRDAADRFQPGKEYYIDFIPAD